MTKLSMQVKPKWPPNIDQIIAAIPSVRGQTGVFFCYGDIIYNPFKVRLGPVDFEHERVHARRQLEMGIDAWWTKYLADKHFRFDEELLAHRAEWQAAQILHPEHMRPTTLKKICLRLAGPLYGNIVSFAMARQMVTSIEPPERLRGVGGSPTLPPTLDAGILWPAG